MKLPVISIALASLALFASCGSANHSAEAQADTTAVNDTVNENAEAEDADNTIRRKVMDWAKALNTEDRELSLSVYAPTVKFYWETYTAQKAADTRLDLTAKKPGYRLTVDGDILVEEMADGRRKAYFTKSSNYKGKQNSYEAYLIFALQPDGDWRIVEESDLTTDKNLRKRAERRAANVPKDAISGDFDGDGDFDFLWVTANMDSDGYATTPFRLRCNNPELGGLEWNSTRGVVLKNLGSLDGSGRDYLGVMPYSDSSWGMYYVYVFRQGQWVKAIEPFSVWSGSESTQPRVKRASRGGYVTIRYNDMGDDGFNDRRADVPLNR